MTELTDTELLAKYLEIENQMAHRGIFSAAYFNKLSHILTEEDIDSTVTMQVFQRQDDQVLCGTKSVLALLAGCPRADELKVMGLEDGSVVSKNETVMTITGPATIFAHLESVYLGKFARQTRVATNVRRLVEVANGKPILGMFDRFDSVGTQIDDGYAGMIGGLAGICTLAHGHLSGAEAKGTMPHALIAIAGVGLTTRAAELYRKHYPNEPATVLVDFENDCVKTTMEVAKVLGPANFGAVRLDTSGSMVDEGVWRELHRRAKAENWDYEKLNEEISRHRGVTALGVQLVRDALDEAGFNHVKIIVSGGFNAEKIALFEKLKVPVDMYGVGSSLIKGGHDFTADIVTVNGKPCAKVGRQYNENPRLVEMDLVAA